MPRNTVYHGQPVEHLSILDEHGAVDASLEPAIDAGLLIKLMRTMLLARRFDERLLALQRQGRIGTFPPIKGQEAAHLGAVAHLRDSDWLVPSFRELAGDLWRGRSLEEIILYNNGYNEGLAIPAQANNLPIAIPVGSQIPHAVGLGWAIRYRGRDDIVMVFFGDGATSQGDFHEALNFAAVYEAPVVFICQNNQWAISVPLRRQTRTPTLAQKASAYGMPGLQVDGNDLLAVYAAAEEAVDRARKGGGPSLIECVTYRLIMHTTSDDPKRYRTEEEVAQWRARDPLPRFETYLKNKGVIDQQAMDALAAQIDADIQTAVERAEARMRQIDDPLRMFEHLHARATEEIKTQRLELEEALKKSPQVGKST